MTQFKTDTMDCFVQAKRIYLLDDKGREIELFVDSNGHLNIFKDDMLIVPVGNNSIRIK